MDSLSFQQILSSLFHFLCFQIVNDLKTFALVFLQIIYWLFQTLLKKSILREIDSQLLG